MGQLSNPQPLAALHRFGGIKRAELLSSLGAGVLGAGVALEFGIGFAPYAVAILLAGLFAHAGGMFLKHQIEREPSRARIVWVEALYWLCWLVLAGLASIIAVQQFS